MQVQNITPSFTGNFTIHHTGKNEKVSFMYNKVLDMVKKNQLTANFRSDSIEISSYKSKDAIVKKTLKEYGIEFLEKAAGKNS